MPANEVDLKKTVNLPKTGFPMKANLPQTEPKLLAQWKQMDLYGQIRESSKGRPRYVLHDGPPYANGRIHLGTAFNKILKDFIVKSKTMAEFDSPYVPGWDCHGLPIEIKVDSELGAKKATMTALQIRRACRKYAEKFVALQSEDFQRLGVFGQWDDPYLTMSAEYEAHIAAAFVEFLDRGFVYKGLKPVHWCIHCRTALAEAEVEYEPHSSPSIWVRFPLVSDPGAIDPALAGKRVYGLIWTTTPWTIPANMAIAFNPRFDYVAVAVHGDVYLLAEDLLKQTAESCGWANPAPMARFKGDRMESTRFRHPFIERDSHGILADHVTLEQGTGAVHTAPGHGQEDYSSGQQYGIATYCPVGADGAFYQAEGADGELPAAILGKSVWDANPHVVAILRESGALLAEKRIEHSYPHCWRCHQATIFRATEQWFIGMERNDLRQRTLEAIRKVKWMPEWGQERISNMIATRPDWCISRQRTWGVPIIVFYCESCAEPLTRRDILDRVVELFRAHTADIWYEKSAAELTGGGVSCQKCGGNGFRKESDILDVWFDSGSSHLAVLNQRYQLEWPSELYLEGGDQYRGWFHSSLLIGVALKGGAPYRECATNGWALDGEGRAMSKSLGNVIAPEEVIKEHGAEVLRLWASSVEFHEDVRISPLILTRLTEAYRKLRNTVRFALGNLADFDPEKHLIPAAAQAEFDQWILCRAEQLIERCRTFYAEFAFHRVYQALYNFATTDLSAIYFDVIKDRLYTAAPESASRRSAQSSLYKLTRVLLRLLAPLLPFTSEEAWSHLQKQSGDPASVHLTLFPQPSEPSDGLPAQAREKAANWEKLLPVREQVLKALEVARQEKFIGAPLEACVRLRAGERLYPLLECYLDQLPALFIVSQAVLEDHAQADLSVHVEKAAGTKCERCWKYSDSVGFDPDFPAVCVSCSGALKEMLG
jgi:isoleucyl-tRNA synthetase